MHFDLFCFIWSNFEKQILQSGWLFLVSSPGAEMSLRDKEGLLEALRISLCLSLPGLLLIESSSDHTFCSIRVSISREQVVTVVTRIYPETSGGSLIFRRQHQKGLVPVEN